MHNVHTRTHARQQLGGPHQSLELSRLHQRAASHWTPAHTCKHRLADLGAKASPSSSTGMSSRNSPCQVCMRTHQKHMASTSDNFERQWRRKSCGSTGSK
jgi:hypothetical protein